MRFAPDLASTTKMADWSFRSGSGVRLLTKAIRVPSGDQAMSETPPGMLVSRRASPPARSNSQTCGPFLISFSSPRAAKKAKCVPAGSQRGLLALAGPHVRRILRTPSQPLTIQRSRCWRSSSALRAATVYATQSPSGETWTSDTVRSLARSSTARSRVGVPACTRPERASSATSKPLKKGRMT